MLTNKEINFLKLIFKKLNGEQENIDFVTEFLMKNLQLDLNKSFTLAYLYVKNWDSEGNFNDIESPERLTYEEFLEDYPTELIVLIKHTDDLNIDSYDYSDPENIEYDGTTYKITDDWDQIERDARDGADYICDDVDGESARHYLTISETDRNMFADELADSYVDDKSDNDIIEEGDISDVIDSLDELESKISDWKELIEEKENSDNQEEIDELEERQSNLEYEIDELKNLIPIEIDMGSQDISKIISNKKESLINEVKEDQRTEYAEQVYDGLDDPYEYFIVEQGWYKNVDDLLKHSHIVSFDCNDYIKDFINGLDGDEIISRLGYENHEEIRYNKKTYYILYN